MKIDSSAAPQATGVAPATGGTRPAAKPATGPAASGSELQSAVLQPAQAALRAMPDIDLDRVEALRQALAEGALPFDAAKLAGLIERFHRSHE